MGIEILVRHETEPVAGSEFDFVVSFDDATFTVWTLSADEFYKANGRYDPSRFDNGKQRYDALISRYRLRPELIIGGGRYEIRNCRLLVSRVPACISNVEIIPYKYAEIIARGIRDSMRNSGYKIRGLEMNKASLYRVNPKTLDSRWSNFPSSRP